MDANTTHFSYFVKSQVQHVDAAGLADRGKREDATQDVLMETRHWISLAARLGKSVGGLARPIDAAEKRELAVERQELTNHCQRLRIERFKPRSVNDRQLVWQPDAKKLES
jgi:hypothetical protein